MPISILSNMSEKPLGQSGPPGPSGASVLNELSALYHVLGYHIKDTAGFSGSVPGLPIGPTTSAGSLGVTGTYERIVPSFGYEKQLQHTSLSPDMAQDPYQANGKILEVDLAWQDIFGNQIKAASPITVPSFTIGYTDAMIALNQWPSTNVGYTISGSGDATLLNIYIRFNAENFEQSGNDPQTALAMYTQLFYQLSQNDVEAEIGCSINSQTQPFSVKQNLLTYINSVYTYLKELIDNQSPTPPSLVTISLTIKDSNPSNIFRLDVQLYVRRTANVSPHFEDVADVQGFTAHILPQLAGVSGAGGPTQYSLRSFSQDIETAFPNLHVATNGEVNSPEAKGTELFLARVSPSATANSIHIEGSNSISYLSLPPLTTHLITGTVQIYDYISGTPIQDGSTSMQRRTNVNMDQLAQTFLGAVESFLSPAYSVPTWKIFYDGTVPPTTPYQTIVDSKKNLSYLLPRHVTGIYEGVSPSMAGMSAAKAALTNALLINMNNAYAFDTIVQQPISVQSQYHDSASPNLEGVWQNTSDTTAAFSFSQSKLSIADTPVEAPTYLTSIFTAKDREANANISLLPTFKVSALETNIHKIPAISNYNASTWLSFVTPFSAYPAGPTFHIPVPLRQYPTSPSLVSQGMTAGAPQFLDLPEKKQGSSDPTLPELKQWTYSFTYDYLAADQDTVYADVSFNTTQLGLKPRLRDGLDLFVTLAQFDAAYPGIQDDFETSLLSDPPQTEIAKNAVSSFSWLVERVYNAWGSWLEDKDYYYQSPLLAQLNYQYQIQEGQTAYESHSDLFGLTIRQMGATGPTLGVPIVDIFQPGLSGQFDGKNRYQPIITALGPTSACFVYKDLTTDQYVTMADRDDQKLTQRKVQIEDLDILVQENAWSGVFIRRNEDLGAKFNLRTNPDFIYQTPTIRFKNRLTPLLDPDAKIDMYTYSETDSPIALNLCLQRFFQAFFTELSEETTTRKIKLGAMYQYDIGQDDPVKTRIPIFSSLPYDFEIPTDYYQSCDNPSTPFPCQVSAMIKQWVEAHHPSTQESQLIFDLSLFSSLTDSQDPILRIRHIFIDTNHINWSATWGGN